MIRVYRYVDLTLFRKVARYDICWMDNGLDTWSSIIDKYDSFAHEDVIGALLIDAHKKGAYNFVVPPKITQRDELIKIPSWYYL